jgi:hypothetical protein
VTNDPRPWFCAECGYALLDEPNWQTHQEWHRRERVRAEYAEADAEIEAVERTCPLRRERSCDCGYGECRLAIRVGEIRAKQRAGV